MPLEMNAPYSWPKCLGIASLAVLVGCVVRLAIGVFVVDSLAFLTFFPAVFFAAWYGGFRTAVLATMLSCAVVAFLVLSPTIVLNDVGAQIGIGVFMFVGLATGVLAERSQRAEHAAREQAVAARQERERLRVTFSSIGDAVIVTDAHGDVTSMNAVAEELTGWTEALACGLPLVTVFPIFNEKTRLPVSSPVQKVIETGRIVGLANHTILISKDGSERPIDDSAAPIRDDTGRLLGVVLVFRDITERHKSETMLRDSEEQFRMAVLNSPIPVFMHAEDGEMLATSKSLIASSGYAAEEISTFSAWANLAYGTRAAEITAATLKRFQPLDESETEEIAVTTKSGTQRLWQITTSPPGRLRDGRQYLVSMVVDVTERAESERTIRFLADASVALASLVDRSSTMQRIARRMTPQFADFCVLDLIGTDGQLERIAFAHADAKLEQLLHEFVGGYRLDWDSTSANVRAIRQAMPVFVAEVSEEFLASLANSEQDLSLLRQLDIRSLLSVPILLRDRPAGAIGLVRSGGRAPFSEQDVELAEEIARRVAIALENSRLYEEVRKASEQKDDFLAMLAHELRNPLAAIELANQLSETSDGKDVAMAREITTRQVKNLSHLIDDLLDLSRITRDKIQLKRELVDIRTVVHSAAATINPLMGERQHVLSIECPEEAIHVDADPVRIEQVLVNLLSNAAKYTPHGGRIAVTVALDGADVVIRVRDNGVGIPAEMLPGVFELFTQLDRTLDRSQGGLGIGLTLVRRLVELHGGTVSARSDGLGQGSEFTVRLIARQATAASDNQQESREPMIRPGLKVLVVDDNRDTARAQALLLKARGCDVVVGHDGLSALDKAREFQPEAFVLDIGLPGIDGYELVGRLKTSGFEHCTFIAVSGYGQPDDRTRSQRAGFHHHLVKPVVGDVLYSLLARVSASEAAD